MIKKIEISGYKSIDNLKIDLRNLNIFIGGNGVGKSNFISIFTFIKNIYGSNLQAHIRNKGGANSLLYFGSKQTDQIKIKLYLSSESQQNSFMINLGISNDSLFINNIKTSYFYEGKWKERIFESNVLESNFRNINESQAYYVNKRLKEFEVYHFHDTSDKSPMKAASYVNDNYYLKNDGSNIAAYLYFLKQKHPKHFYRIEAIVKSIAPFFEFFVLEPDRLNEEIIRLEWKEKGNVDAYFNAYHLSDGTLRFICLTTLLMQPHPPETIIIDEPELGLHPNAIAKLSGLLKKIDNRHQIILSTQSTDLIDYFNPEDIIISERHHGQSTFKRLNAHDLTVWLDDYSLSELWEQNKIGAQPYNDYLID